MEFQFLFTVIFLSLVLSGQTLLAQTDRSYPQSVLMQNRTEVGYVLHSQRACCHSPKVGIPLIKATDGYFSSSNCCPPSIQQVLSVRVPLCPAIAAASFDTKESGKGKIINRFAEEYAKRLNVEIVPISSFEAEVIGAPNQVNRFLDFYPSLLCAFNSTIVRNDEQVYRGCLRNVEKWMTIVENKRPSELMATGTAFCPICCQTFEELAPGDDGSSVQHPIFEER